MTDYKLIPWDELKPVLDKGVDQTIYTFDIETSSGFIPEGQDTARPFDPELPPSYYQHCQKVALCYEWQFGINDTVYYGRELWQFKEVLDKLTGIKGIHYIWVHNLGFEQAFLLNLFYPDKLFARKAHQPIYMEIANIIFRCSFVLTNMSLKTWAESIGAPAKIEDYDYDTIRTPYSPLTPEELAYGERDCIIVYEGIKWFLNIYGTIQKIPLTQTSRVRREINNLFHGNAAYRFRMARLLPKSAEEYARLRMAFTGGNVHANWYYADTLLKSEDFGGVSSCDIASSYPFAALTGPLPMSPWTRARHSEKFINNEKYCTLIEVELYDLKAIGYIDFISYSKCYNCAMKEETVISKRGRKVIKRSLDGTVENGRVHDAKKVTMMITGIDFSVIQKCYTFEYKILNLWYSSAGLLPKKYANFILDLYADKTTLKGVEGKEDIYQNKKQMLNGIYGDFVTAIVYDDTELLPDGSWKEETKDFNDIQERLKYLREKPWRLKSSFAWGVWITSIARANHFSILMDIDKDNDVVYYDTDSVYYLGNHDADIERYNKLARDKIDKALEKLGIDPERSRPKDKKGTVHQLGALEIEKRGLPEFKAVRAKCYGYRDHDGQLHITVSGVNKSKGVGALHDNLDNLTKDLVFDYKYCGKQISNYNINQPVCKWVGTESRTYISTYKYGLNLQPTRYEVTLSQEFFDILKAIGALSSHISTISIDRLKQVESSGKE